MKLAALVTFLTTRVQPYSDKGRGEERIPHNPAHGKPAHGTPASPHTRRRATEQRFSCPDILDYHASRGDEKHEQTVQTRVRGYGLSYELWMGTFTDSGGPCAQTEALALHRTAPWGKEDANGRFAPALGVLIEAKPG